MRRWVQLDRHSALELQRQGHRDRHPFARGQLSDIEDSFRSGREHGPPLMHRVHDHADGPGRAPLVDQQLHLDGGRRGGVGPGGHRQTGGGQVTLECDGINDRGLR